MRIRVTFIRKNNDGLKNPICYICQNYQQTKRPGRKTDILGRYL
jgi:hypothetical protein